MSVEAPLSKHKRTTFLIWIAVCIAVGAYCVYDGYFNQKFIEKHTREDGRPDSTLAFNKKAPPVLFAVAVLMGGYLLAIRNRKIVAEEEELVIHGKERIRYDQIEKIDKTHFDSKGYFVLTCKGEGGSEFDRKISDRNYDNLGVLLEHLIGKIT
jgi:hypothetical protein